jgi:hypothetical protein
MPPTRTAPAPSAITEQLAREIGSDCNRALRRLERLQGERHDVVLAHARQLIRRAAALSRAIERHQHA